VLTIQSKYVQNEYCKVLPVLIKYLPIHFCVHSDLNPNFTDPTGGWTDNTWDAGNAANAGDAGVCHR